MDKWPSVTQVLPKQNFFCSKEELEAYAREGSQTHAKIEVYLSTGVVYDDPDVIEVDRVLKDNAKYLGSLVTFEERLKSEKHKFTGKPDMIFEYAIVDLKRSLTDKRYHALQLAGYNMLASENKIIKSTKKHYILHRYNGKYKLVNVYNDMAKAVFLSCLKKYQIEQNINKYLKGV